MRTAITSATMIACLAALSSHAHAEIIGAQVTEVDFSNGYVNADGSINASNAVEIGAAWSSFGQQWDTYRLWVQVDSLDDRINTVSGSQDNAINLVLNPGAGGVFFQEPLGLTVPPDTAFFGVVPTLAFDTFYSLGSSDASLAGPGIVDSSNGLQNLNGLYEFDNAGWFLPGPALGQDGIVSDGEGGFRVLLGQFTVAEDSTFSGQAIITGIGLQEFVTFSSEIPAPGTVAVLAAAGLAGSRRRR
ncbi:MAG: MYXO-CTERM sorting domain-containing protein [Planctomycetota bacterium]